MAQRNHLVIDNNLLFVDELLLGEVEDLVALPGGGLSNHLAQCQLDVLRFHSMLSNRVPTAWQVYRMDRRNNRTERG